MPQMEYSATEVDEAITTAIATAGQQSSDALAQLASSLQAQIDALKPPVPPPPPTAALKVGASDLSAFPGVTLEAHRVFYSVATGALPAVALTAARAAAASKMRLVLSLDRGKHTAGWVAPDPVVLSSYLPALTATDDLRVILHHEPENDFKKPTDGAVLTQAQNLAGYQSWYLAAARWMRANAPAVPIGPCLMAWVAAKGSPGWGYWLDALPDNLIDFIGVDGYANPGDPSPNLLLQTAYAYALKRGKPMIIAETGQETTGDQVAWLSGLVSWAQQQSKANPRSPIDTITWWPGNGPNGSYPPNPALMASLPHILAAT